MSDREQAWDELCAAMPAGWYVGTPVHQVGRDQWAQYAFDTTARVKAGKRSREWTAVGQTEADCIREMARWLRAIGAGRAPR